MSPRVVYAICIVAVLWAIAMRVSFERARFQEAEACHKKEGIIVKSYSGTLCIKGIIIVP